MKKNKKLLVYLFVWYPCLGFIMAWILTFYEKNIVENYSIENYSIERINNAFSNMFLNIFRIFEFNIYFLRKNESYYHSDLISIILFINGILILIIFFYFIEFYLKKKLENIGFRYYSYIIVLFFLYCITYYSIISPMVFEGFLISFIIFLFYKLNSYLTKI